MSVIYDDKKDIIDNDSTNDNNDAGDFEYRGRLSERLKKIARNKRKKVNEEIEDTVNDTKNFGTIKRFFLIPIMFLSGIIGKRNVTNNSKSIDKITVSKNLQGNSSSKLVTINKKRWKNEIRQRNFLKIDQVNDSKNSLNKLLVGEKKKNNTSNVVNFNSLLVKSKKNVVQENSNGVEDLEKEILNLIKKRLTKLINEYEMLSSDFYILKELLTDDVYYEKCLKNVKEIKKLLTKINTLKDKYDYLKNNIDFDNILELDDKLIQEKIIELKNKLNDDDLNYLVKDYKLLNEYKSLYLKVDKLQDEAYEYEKERKKKVDILKEQKVDFEKFKLSIYNYKSTNEGYNTFVKKQNEIVNELSAKIGVIDSYEKVNYIFKGYRGLLFNSFKYIGLLLLNPLKGILPGIATQTIITKNVLDNLKKTTNVEEKRKIVYEAIDYGSEITRVVDDIDYMRMIIDSSLEDVAELKKKYNEEFRKYEGNYREYYEAIKQLNKIENSIISNKVKVDLMKERMIINSKVNDEAKVKVKKLNL